MESPSAHFMITLLSNGTVLGHAFFIAKGSVNGSTQAATKRLTHAL
jgi:hypothetical protein